MTHKQHIQAQARLQKRLFKDKRRRPALTPQDVERVLNHFRLRGGKLYPVDFPRVDPQQILLPSLLRTGHIIEVNRLTVDYHLALKEDKDAET